jgi:hypothetical protein
MRFRAIVIAFAVMVYVLFGMSLASSQSLDSAKQFLASVYAAYTYNGNPPPIDAGGTDAIVSPSLFRLIQKNQSILNGEAGCLDVDPICRCQDFDVEVTGIEVEMQGRRRARALVSFQNFNQSDEVWFDLVWVNGGWRIDDIKDSQGQHGLRDALKMEIEN